MTELRGADAAHEDLVIAPDSASIAWLRLALPERIPLRAVANDQAIPRRWGTGSGGCPGEPFVMRLPGSLPAVPLPHIGEKEVSNRRRLTLSTKNPEFPPAANYQEFAYLICGERFDPNGWISGFRSVRSRNGWSSTRAPTTTSSTFTPTTRSGGSERCGPQRSVWRDTVIVPRKGSVTFRSRSWISLALCPALPHDEP